MEPTNLTQAFRQNQDNAMPKKKTYRSSPTPKAKRILKRIGIALIVLLVIYVLPTIKLIRDAQAARKTASAFSQSLKAQNLDEIKTNSQKLRQDLKRIKSDLYPYYPLRIIPFFGGYVSDGTHIVTAGFHGLNAIDITTEELTPYADLLGLKGNVGTAGTAEERLQLAVTTLEKITPKFDLIAKEFSKVKDEIDYINLARYPKFLFGDKISSGIAQGKTTVDSLGSIIVEARPLIEVLPSMLGAQQPRTYLVLFQNDKELRPSGGFLTAYTYITIDKGKITASDSNDMYNLDELIHKQCRRMQCFDLRPPKFITTYLKESTGQNKTAWDSRDTNIHPDFVASAIEFQKHYKIAGLKQVDGIIAVDTRVIQDILGVTGPVKVAGYPNDFTKDNVLGLLMAYTDYVQVGKADRKSLLGDLMGSVLNFVSDFGRDKFQPMITTSLSLLNEKHILIYMFDEKSQMAIEKFNWAGRIKEYDGDYLHINDSNFASGKANAYIKHKYDIKMELKDGQIYKTVKVFTEDPQGYHDVLNRNYRNAMRIYVPKGSVLVSAELAANGANAKQANVDTYEEFNKTVFESFIQTNAKNKSEFTITYKLPGNYKKGDEYKVMIQKQPGIDGWEYNLDMFGKKENFKLTQDREIKAKI